MGRPIRSLFSTLFIIRNFPRPRNASLYIFAVMKQKWSPRPPLKRTIKAASVYFEIFLLSLFFYYFLSPRRPPRAIKFFPHFRAWVIEENSLRIPILPLPLPSPSRNFSTPLQNLPIFRPALIPSRILTTLLPLYERKEDSCSIIGGVDSRNRENSPSNPINVPREFCEGNARLAEFRKSTVKDGGAVVDATWKLVTRLMEGNNKSHR